jgi:hypothetical protein
MKKKPTKKQIDYALSVIATMRAFISGRPVQRRGKITTSNRWQTFDLGKFIDDGPLDYRPGRKNVR